MKRFIQLCAAVCAMASAALGQGTAVNQSLGPPPTNWVTLYWCGTGMTACASGNTQVSAICAAPALAPTTTYAIGSTPGLTNIVVSTNVGTITFATTAQVWVGMRVTVAGSTTAALNGTYRVNTVSGSTATITTSGVADATYNNAAMTVATSGPILGASTWSILLLPFTDTSVNASYYAGGATVGVPSALACSSRTSY